MSAARFPPLQPHAAPAAPAAAEGASIGDFRPRSRAPATTASSPGDDFFAYANGTWDKSFVDPGGQGQLRSLRPARRALQGARARASSSSAAAAHRPTARPSSRSATTTPPSWTRRRSKPTGSRRRSRTCSASPRPSRASRRRAPVRRGRASPRSSTSSSPPDFKNPDRYAVVISESSLGLPDRDYYLKDDPTLKALREKYVAYVGADADPGRQRRSARPGARHHGVRDGGGQGAVADREAARLEATYNPRTKAQLLGLRAGLSLAGLPRCRAARRAPAAGARRSSPPCSDLAELFSRTPVPTLKAFLTFHYLSGNAPYLPQRFDAGALCLLRQDAARPAAAARALEARRGRGGRRRSASPSAGSTWRSISRPSRRPRCSSWWRTSRRRSASASMRSTG